MSFENVPDDKDTLSFLSDFIREHPRLKPNEEMAYIREYKYALDVKEQLLRERTKLSEQMADCPPGLAYGELYEEYKGIEEALKTNPLILNMHKPRNTLIEHNLKLVIHVATKYSGKGMELNDLVQEGILGFIKAIEKYDPSYNVKLGTYAVWWIRQKITRALSNSVRMVRIPVHVSSEVTKVLSYVRKHRLDIADYYAEDIAKGLDMTTERVLYLFTLIGSFYPINQVVDFSTSSDSGTSDSDGASDNSFEAYDKPFVEGDMFLDDQIFHRQIYFDFLDFIEDLSPLEIYCVSSYYGWTTLGKQSFVSIDDTLRVLGIKESSRDIVGRAVHSLVTKAFSY